MFKVGDKVIKKDKNKNVSGLEKNKIYTITYCNINFNETVDNKYYICKVNNKEKYLYNTNLFISLSEIRKQKIKKICSKLEIK